MSHDLKVSEQTHHRWRRHYSGIQAERRLALRVGVKEHFQPPAPNAEPRRSSSSVPPEMPDELCEMNWSLVTTPP